MRKIKPLNDFTFLRTKGYHSSFHFWEDEEKDYMLTDAAEIHFIEYPKFRKLADKNYKDSAIERWLAFLEKDISEETLRELVDMEPAIKKAENKLAFLSSDEETMSIYYAREKSLHDQANLVNSAEERGKEQGIQQGIQQEKFSIAKRLLMSGMSEELVSNMTELNLEQVKKMKIELD